MTTVKVAPPSKTFSHMSMAATDLKVGSRIRVDLDRVRDRIPSSLKQLLQKEPRGKLVDFKMTDGMGVGVIVELSDGSKSWFFNEEVVRG